LGDIGSSVSETLDKRNAPRLRALEVMRAAACQRLRAAPPDQVKVATAKLIQDKILEHTNVLFNFMDFSRKKIGP
jgi:hypothetical protein